MQASQHSLHRLLAPLFAQDAQHQHADIAVGAGKLREGECDQRIGRGLADLQQGIAS